MTLYNLEELTLINYPILKMQSDLCTWRVKCHTLEGIWSFKSVFCSLWYSMSTVCSLSCCCNASLLLSLLTYQMDQHCSTWYEWSCRSYSLTLYTLNRLIFNRQLWTSHSLFSDLKTGYNTAQTWAHVVCEFHITLIERKYITKPNEKLYTNTQFCCLQNLK